MAWFWSKSQETKVKIPAAEEKDGVVFYKIQLNVGDVMWELSHRYRDFFELHTKLVNDHGVAKDILPPKKLIGTKCPQFIEIRRQGLENYLQKVLKFLKLTMPRIFIEFLHFHLYDIFFVLQTLAERFYSEGSICTTSDFNTLEMHAISTCCLTPLYVDNVCDKKYDFTHVLDFCSKLNILRVNGSFNFYLKSNIKPNELVYEFKCFKRVNTLVLNAVCLDSIKDLGPLRDNLERLTITNSKMCDLCQILQCDVLHKESFDPKQMWNNLMVMDLSSNNLHEINRINNLVPNLQVLILDHNRFTNIPNVIQMKKLTTLSMCGNLISDCEQLHLLLPNILYLDLSQNKIKSLEGFAKLCSLISLNLTGNDIQYIEEIRFLCELPHIENLILTGNKVSTMVDYRLKVLGYFGKKAEEICLDNEQPLQSEIDKVSIRRALKTLSEGSVSDFLKCAH